MFAKHLRSKRRKTSDQRRDYVTLLEISVLFRLLFFSPKKHLTFSNESKKKTHENISEWMNIHVWRLIYFLFIVRFEFVLPVAIDVQKHVSYPTYINNSRLFYVSQIDCFFFFSLISLNTIYTRIDWSVQHDLILHLSQTISEQDC